MKAPGPSVQFGLEALHNNTRTRTATKTKHVIAQPPTTRQQITMIKNDTKWRMGSRHHGGGYRKYNHLPYSATTTLHITASHASHAAGILSRFLRLHLF